MQFTGSELTLKRNFFTQTGYYGFTADITVDNTSGEYHFGLTGNAGALDFRLQSGKLYYGSQFLHTYKAHQEFSIEGQFTSGSANIIKDGQALAFNTPKATGYVDYFYFTRGSTALAGDFDVEISGNNTPIYSITTQGYLLTSGQAGVTGYFANQSQFPIKVFASEIQATQNYEFGQLASTVVGGATGIFAYSGDFANIDLTQPILTTFHTNFDDTSILFTIIDASSTNRFVYFTGPTDFTFNSTGILNRDLTYLNYSGGNVVTNFNTSLVFRLSLVSGTGTFAGTPSGFAVPGIGRFRESGLLTGLQGSSPVTGFAWATGPATGFFSGIGTGIASGINYTGLAVGTFTGRTTGFIFDGSGTLNVGYPLVGIGLNGFSLFPTGAQRFATGYIDFSSYSNGQGFSLDNPDAGATFTMRAGGGPGDPATPSCNGLGLFLMDTLSQITGIAPCISGFSSLGVTAIYNGGSIINFSASTAGVLGNDITVSSDWVSPGDGNFMGGADGVGSTGVVVFPVGTPYTGAFNVVITGSGLYTGTITGQSATTYTKTFTGSWDLLTGVDTNSLISLKTPGQFNSTMISGSGNFPPNSQFTFQVTHNLVDANNDSSYLAISGSEVLNPIAQTLVN